MWSPAGPQLAYASSLPDPSARSQLFSHATTAPRPCSSRREGGRVGRRTEPRSRSSPRRGSTSSIPTAPASIGWPSPSKPARPPGRRTGPRSPTQPWSRYRKYIPPGEEISVANADGSGMRQLTDLGSQSVFDDAPTWSPDGDQILFRRIPFTSPPPDTGPLWTMNPDGTCQGELAAVASWELPSWQALPGGPAVGRKTCAADLALDGARTANQAGSAITIHATVSNEGTEPLTDVMLEISAPGHDLGFKLSGGGCTRETEGLFCESLRLGGGESREVTASAMARRVGLDQNSRAVPLSRAIARDRQGRPAEDRRSSSSRRAAA